MEPCATHSIGREVDPGSDEYGRNFLHQLESPADRGRTVCREKLFGLEPTMYPMCNTWRDADGPVAPLAACFGPVDDHDTWHQRAHRSPTLLQLAYQSPHRRVRHCPPMHSIMGALILLFDWDSPAPGHDLDSFSKSKRRRTNIERCDSA